MPVVGVDFPRVALSEARFDGAALDLAAEGDDLIVELVADSRPVVIKKSGK